MRVAARESSRVSVKGTRPLSVYGDQSLQGLRGEKGVQLPFTHVAPVALQP